MCLSSSWTISRGVIEDMAQAPAPLLAPSVSIVSWRFV
jgi:hypothetical protein